MCCIVNTFYKVALTSILGTAAEVHSVSGWLLNFGVTALASDCWLWGALVFFSFLNMSVDTRCLVGTGRWHGDGWRKDASWAGVDSDTLVICWHGNNKNPLKKKTRLNHVFFPQNNINSYHLTRPLWDRYILPVFIKASPLVILGTHHCHVQQVVDLQLLVDALPVLFHLLLLLPGQVTISLIDGTLLFHIIPGQSLPYLKASQTGRSLLVSGYPGLVEVFIDLSIDKNVLFFLQFW